MYYNLWNIRKTMSHYFMDCSSDQGTFKKAKWQLGFKCPSSCSTLKASVASKILTTTGGSTSLKPHPSSLYHFPTKASFGVLPQDISSTKQSPIRLTPKSLPYLPFRRSLLCSNSTSSKFYARSSPFFSAHLLRLPTLLLGEHWTGKANQT
jgi:hypothetical protein